MRINRVYYDEVFMSNLIKWRGTGTHFTLHIHNLRPKTSCQKLQHSGTIVNLKDINDIPGLSRPRIPLSHSSLLQLGDIATC